MIAVLDLLFSKELVLLMSKVLRFDEAICLFFLFFEKMFPFELE